MEIQNKIKIHLKSHGITPSYQRLKVYEFLLENRIHPTVDVIYKHLSKEMPTLSKTTVYNTLNLFIERKVVQLISIEENETRYDSDTSAHGHFKCEKCKEIYDFEVDVQEVVVSGLDGFIVNEKHYYYRGMCKKCIKA